MVVAGNEGEKKSEVPRLNWNNGKTYIVLFQVTFCYLYPHFNVEFSRPTRSLYAHDLLSYIMCQFNSPCTLVYSRSQVASHRHRKDLSWMSRVGEGVNEEVQGFRALWRFVEAKSNKLRRKKPVTDSSALLIDVQNTELFGSPQFVGFAGRAQPCSCWKTCGALPWCSNYVTRWAEGRRGWKNDPKSTLQKAGKRRRPLWRQPFIFVGFHHFFHHFLVFFLVVFSHLVPR